MSQISNSGAMLKSYVERIENLQKEVKEKIETEVAPLRSDIRDIYKEAKGNGFNTKALREAMRRKGLDRELRDEVEMYESSILAELLG